MQHILYVCIAGLPYSTGDTHEPAAESVLPPSLLNPLCGECSHFGCAWKAWILYFSSCGARLRGCNHLGTLSFARRVRGGTQVSQQQSNVATQPNNKINLQVNFTNLLVILWLPFVCISCVVLHLLVSWTVKVHLGIKSENGWGLGVHVVICWPAAESVLPPSLLNPSSGDCWHFGLPLIILLTLQYIES